MSTHRRLTRLLLYGLGCIAFLTGCTGPGTNGQGQGATPSADPIPVPVATNPARELVSAVGFYLDTQIRISAYNATQEELTELLTICGEYERLLSKTIAGSDVYKLNHAGGKPLTVSGHTIRILEKAIAVSAASGGAFDVTIAPASALWDFQAAEPVLPDADALAEAASRADYTGILIDGDMVSLRPGIEIDLGGIAKGYIADEIAAICASRGIGAALLNFGGNVIVLGEKSPGTPWTVGIQDPDDPNGVIASVPATDCTVVTSGTYERGFTLDGVRYHHILDTATGWPIDNGLSSVSIITESSMEADALSTACFALGETAARSMLAQHFPTVEAVFVYKDRTIAATEGIADAIRLLE